MPLILYHYSADKYPQLETLKYRGNDVGDKYGKTTKEIRPGTYSEHISFFLEQPPLDILGTIFGIKHHTWFPGNSMFEHQVDLEKVGVFKYLFVETPEKTKLYYDDSVGTDEYYKRLNRVNRTKLYIGSSLTEFKRPYTELKGRTREFYKLLPTRPNFDELRDKYAATVPHVMLYPMSGVCPVVSCRRVTVGGMSL